MTEHNRLKHHADLMDRMASAVGLDLEEELFRGALAPGDVPDAVLRCQACPDPDHCAGWLDRNTKGATATPGYCKNADLFASLREQSSARG